MPYQPTNPYPYNTGVDLREGLTLQFRVDNYDTIIKFEIELYDLFKNEKIYTIIREIGEIDNSKEEKVLIEGDKQIIRIFDETNTLVYFNYYEGESVLPVVGGLSEESVCKIELTNYLKTIEQIQYEKYYNRVTDFEGFEITEINEPENTDLSYYILEKLEDSNNYYITGIKEDYKKDYFSTLNKIVVPYQVRVLNQETGAIQNQIVRGIADGVFQDLGNLQEIILPSSLYAIGASVFAGCYSLKNVIFSYGLSEIGDKAFYNCTNLSFIELLDSITKIGVSCFEECTKLNSLVLSNSMNEIPERCFFNNRSLKNIKLKQIKNIGAEAFSGCSNLSVIEFSTFLEVIGANAFQNCTSICELFLPKSLTTIEKGAFYGCENIVEIEIPFIGGGDIEGSTDSAKLFGYIFGEPIEGQEGVTQKYSDSDVDSVVYAIPSSIAKVVLTNETKISYGAFYNCEEIIEIILNEDIAEIGKYAFYNCYNLTNIEIPSGVKFIGNNAFSLENNLFSSEVNE